MVRKCRKNPTTMELIFIALIPSLVASEILCPNGKTTCPEKLHCCEIDGEYSCCDETKMKIYPGEETIEPEPQTPAFSNSSMSAADVPLEYGACNIMSCQGPCCNSYMCCPHQFGSCCSSDRCCGSFSPCCGTGCCGAMSECCGTRCCPFQSKCCGSWCCKNKYKCGTRYLTCDKGVAFAPEISTVLVLAFGVLMSRHL